MKPDRLIGFDVARTLAYVGMVIVNFKTVMAFNADSSHPLMQLMGMLEGRAAATFVILAGCGIAMMTRRARENNDPELIRSSRVSLQKRAVFLFVFGIAYSPLWPADILHFYGLYMILASFLIVAKSQTLFIWMGALITLAYLMLFVLDYETGWDFESLVYLDFWTLSGMVRHMFYNGFHPVFPWAAFMLFGLWLGRLDWSNKATPIRLMIGGLAAAVATELVSKGMLATALPEMTISEGEDLTAILGTEPMPPTPFYMIASGGWATAVIAGCMMLTKQFPSRMWLPLVYTGQMALTLYVAHVFLGMGLLDVFGRMENNTPEFVFGYALGFSGVSIAFATVWRRFYARGPLEWVMRKVAG
ncbi:MAG: hypothetical protein COA73_01640 [Candidatus Hydrogenedentota bacterium]|nr:MAG: hypothetical protein COA73_01640 [Candidatus Hydrogenedentota bacterium]